MPMTVAFLRMLLAVAIGCLAALGAARSETPAAAPKTSLGMAQNPYFGSEITEPFTRLTLRQREWWRLLNEDPRLQPQTLPETERCRSIASVARTRQPTSCSGTCCWMCGQPVTAWSMPPRLAAATSQPTGMPPAMRWTGSWAG